MAYNFTFVFMMMSLIFFSQTSPELKKTQFMPSLKVVRDIPAHFISGFPNLIMVCLEMWVWELMTFLSGFFSVQESAAQVLLVTITNTAFQIGQGLDQTACALIGNEIGKGDVK